MNIYRQLINVSKGFDNNINKDIFNNIINLLSETYEYWYYTTNIFTK